MKKSSYTQGPSCEPLGSDWPIMFLPYSLKRCYAYGGHQGGPQLVSLDDDCVCSLEMNCTYLGIYVVQHELMHVAGFMHEQERYDRDDYVVINFDNIQPGN